MCRTWRAQRTLLVVHALGWVNTRRGVRSCAGSPHTSASSVDCWWWGGDAWSKTMGHGGRPQDKFVWPPRRSGGVVEAAGETPVAQAARMEVLPLFRQVEVAAPAVVVPAGGLKGAAPGSRMAELWRSVEETWLDVRCPRLHDRLAALGCAPDRSGAYCHRCGQTAPPHGLDEGGCPRCRDRRLAWSRLVRLGEYRSPWHRMIQEVKFTRWRRLGKDLGHLLGESVVAEMERMRGAGKVLPRRVVVVPVPTTLRRSLRRGIDHAGVIAEGVAARIPGASVERGLLRREHRPSQLSVPASARARNVAGAITPRSGGGAARRAGNLAGALVVVVDDVTTTGATMGGTCRGVKRAIRLSGRAESPLLWAAVIGVTPARGP